VAETWVLIGIVGTFSFGVLVLHATLHARFSHIDERFERLTAEFRAEIRALGDRLETPMERLDVRMERLDVRMGRLEERFEAHERLHPS
jgi:chaperonin cofactor prefoldin